MATLSIINAILPQGQIRWDDTDTIENRTGSSSNIVVEQTYGIYDPEAEIIPVWEYFNGTSWVDSGFAGGSLTKTFTGLVNGINKFRIKLVQQYNSNTIIGYSNILQYTLSIVCPQVTDLTFTENTVNLQPYEIRSFNFSWTKVLGKTYRLEFQNNGASSGFNDNASGMNTPGATVTVYGITLDKVRVVTICENSVETPSIWYNILPAVLPTQSYWYEGRWGKGDTIHHPEVNSWVKYLDENGVENTQIIGPIEWGCQKVVASSIVQTNGVQTCISGKKRSLLKGNMSCGAGLVHFKGTAIILYSESQGSNVVDGDRVFTDQEMTMPYTGSTGNLFLKDTNNNKIYSVDTQGYITFEGYQGGPC